MVTPVNTIDHSEGYVAFSSSVDQAVQYDEACLQLHNLCDAVGTIEQSCDGSTVSTSGTNISTTAHMVHGTAASQAHTWWIVLIGDTRYLFELDNVNTDTTPQQIRVYKATAPYNTDGSTTTKPTISVAGREFTSATVNIIPNATATASGYFWWHNSAIGSFIFAVKNSGDAFYRVGICHFQGGTDGDSETDFANLLFLSSGATSRFTSTLLESASSYTSMGSIAAGTVSANVGIVTSPVWAVLSQATNGLAASRAKFRELTFGINSTGSSGRYFGVADDIRACPPNLVFNSEDPNETGTHRLRSLGAICVPLRTATADV